jgi:hypothetical protein
MERIAYLSGRDSTGANVIYRRNNELRNGTDRHSNHEEDSATTNFADYAAVNDDNGDTDSGKDARILEGVAHFCHFEEVGTIR